MVCDPKFKAAPEKSKRKKREREKRCGSFEYAILTVKSPIRYYNDRKTIRFVISKVVGRNFFLNFVLTFCKWKALSLFMRNGGESSGSTYREYGWFTLFLFYLYYFFYRILFLSCMGEHILRGMLYELWGSKNSLVRKKCMFVSLGGED